jgi:hypothetical protein
MIASSFGGKATGTLLTFELKVFISGTAVNARPFPDVSGAIGAAAWAA